MIGEHVETSGVLVIASSSDAHADAVALELMARGVPVWRWDPDTFPRESPLSITLDVEKENAVLETPSGPLPLEQVKSVWLRRRVFSLFASYDKPDDHVAFFVRLELEAAFRGLAHVLRHARWVNAPAALYAIESPLTHVQGAAAAGLLVPHTLLTTDAASPRLIQETPAGEAELRLLAVGQEIFSAERPGPEAEYRQCPLPSAVSDACLDLLRRWGVVFGGIDMVRRPDGALVFTGFDAEAEWLNLERESGLRITAAVADLLDPRLDPRPA